MKKTYSIGDVAKITNVTEKQLRYWEQHNVLDDIKRVVCGERAYRRYSADQIKLIHRIKENLEMGYTLSASARLAKDHTGKGGR